MAENEGEFISRIFFDKLEHFTGDDDVLHWSELKVDVVYKIDKIQEYIHKQYGLSGILHYSDEADEYKVWCPKHMFKQILANRGDTTRPYFVSQGVVAESNKALFQLSYIDVKKEFPIFFKPIEKKGNDEGTKGIKRAFSSSYPENAGSSKSINDNKKGRKY